MNDIGTFPFGQQVQEVIQQDHTQKRVFVLGVYASAVHAQWIGNHNKTKVKALAVASEPYIFWRGDNAAEIIEQIDIPQSLGKLVPANKQYNGPSGIALDDLILQPLGLTRSDVWLCDLIPHSCVNPSQRKAIINNYEPFIEEYDLPIPTVPEVPGQLTDSKRRAAILEELIESSAETLILLGDKPIQWFLKYFDQRRKRLSDFTQDEDSYGKLHSTQINRKIIKILPLAHPRQIAKLGSSSAKWYEYHQTWMHQTAHKIFS
jgi:uracil-DNA glycosylase